MTLEAIIELDGRVRILEPLKLVKPARAFITILAEESKLPSTSSVQAPKVESDFSKLIASLAEFPADFMAEGREQPAIPEREVIF